MQGSKFGQSVRETELADLDCKAAACYLAISPFFAEGDNRS